LRRGPRRRSQGTLHLVEARPGRGALGAGVLSRWPDLGDPVGDGSDARSTVSAVDGALASPLDRSGVLVKQPSQLALGALEARTSPLRKLSAGAIDIEREHRHCRAVRVGLAASAVLSRALERTRDRARILECEDTLLQVQRIAVFGDVLRPASPLACSAHA